MPNELSLEGIKRLPKWAWVVGVAGAIGLAVWYRTSSAKSVPAGTTGTVTLPGSTDTLGPNTSTPTGSFCPSYAHPNCGAADFVINEVDENGCPKPVCASSLLGIGSGGSGGSGPVCSSTQHGGQCTVGKNCPGSTLRQIFNAVGQDVNCAVGWNPSPGTNITLDYPLWYGYWVHY